MRMLGIGRIRESTKKLSGRVPENGRIREYHKMVESVQVFRIGRIHQSAKKLSGRVPEKGRIRVSTEKWKNRCEYRE